jgi:hypothetical protein
MVLSIPNEYGRWLDEILKPIDSKLFSLLLGYGEEYNVIDDSLVPLFPEDIQIIDGETFSKLIDSICF